jgi:hypothetical protein
MAAFIQRLFKSRKATPASAPKNSTPKAAEASQQEARTERQLLRESQENQLRNNPPQPELAQLAIDGVTAAIRLEAANGLQQEELLQQVLKQAKGRDKGVYQAVKQSLQTVKDQQAAETAMQQRIEALITQAQDQARSEDTKLYEARLDAAQESWRSVEASASAEQAGQFLAAVHDCRERLKQLKQVQEDEKRHQEQARQRTETLELLQQTLTDLQTASAEDLPSASALDALQKTQENRWLEATRDTQVSKQEQKEYEQQMLGLRNYLSAVRRLETMKDSIASLGEAAGSDEATDEQRDAARQLLKELDWPAEFPQPARLEPVRKLAGKPKAAKPADANQEQQSAVMSALKATLPDLEAALEARQFKESKQLLKTAQNQFQQLDGRNRRGFQARIQLLAGQFRELSDWQGFATEPKQVSLCEQMEYLAEQPIEPEAKAERIKELQSEWRELGGSSDRALWSRFKAASDKAYEPCKAYFEAKSDLKQANLQKRQAICDQLATFLDNADWTAIDWKGAERIHQTARQEWKSAWPVDFRDNRQIQKRFDDLLKQLERPLDEERKKNEALKQGIVEKAEALISHEPLQEAMEQAKALQNDWKAIGITRHREDRKLWQAFRTACDQIFARRDAQRSAQQEATEQADQAALETVAQLRELGTESGDQSIAGAIEQLNGLAGNPLSKPVREQVQELKKRLAQTARTRKLKQKINDWQSLVAGRVDNSLDPQTAPESWARLAQNQPAVSGRDLAIRAEILAGADTPEQDQPRRMEIQVQRLTEGMGNTETEAPAQELEKLIALWCLHPEVEDVSASNADRLNRALEVMLGSD